MVQKGPANYAGECGKDRLGWGIGVMPMPYFLNLVRHLRIGDAD